jgi:hypothetical protein
VVYFHFFLVLARGIIPGVGYKIECYGQERSFINYTIEDSISRLISVTSSPDLRVLEIKTFIPLQRFNNPKAQYIRKTAIYTSFTPIYNHSLASTHAIFTS